MFANNNNVNLRMPISPLTDAIFNDWESHLACHLQVLRKSPRGTQIGLVLLCLPLFSLYTPQPSIHRRKCKVLWVDFCILTTQTICEVVGTLYILSHGC